MSRPLLHMPFIRIGGRAHFTPPLLAHLQVDGSYKGRHGRIAIKMTNASHNGLSQITKNLYSAESSTETEWAAIYHGIEYALEANERAMTIENDCLGVINHIYQRHMIPRKEYARYYRSKIYELSAEAEWVGIRWIPRAFNKSDKLFY